VKIEYFRHKVLPNLENKKDNITFLKVYSNEGNLLLHETIPADSSASTFQLQALGMLTSYGGL